MEALVSMTTLDSIAHAQIDIEESIAMQNIPARIHAIQSHATIEANALEKANTTTNARATVAVSMATIANI